MGWRGEDGWNYGDSWVVYTCVESSKMGCNPVFETKQNPIRLRELAEGLLPAWRIKPHLQAVAQ